LLKLKRKKPARPKLRLDLPDICLSVMCAIL
jgi:hypothetical protein